jgi:hypothetical protein
MAIDQTLALVLGLMVGFAAVVVYELKFVIAIERKMTRLLNKIEAMEEKELKEIVSLEETPKKKTRK